MLTTRNDILGFGLRKSSPKSAPRSTSRRILIATEDAQTAGAIGGWLTAAGYDVVVASDAMAARCMPGVFDCGVFSLELPDGNGVILAAHLTAEDKLKTVVFCPSAIHRLDDDNLPAQEEIEKLLEVEAGVAAALAEIQPRSTTVAA